MSPFRARGAALALAFALGACGPAGDRPDQTTRIFWAALAEQDFDRAIAVSSAAQPATLRELVESHPLAGVSVGETLQNERRAVVETHATLAGRETAIQFETRLVRSEETWRVDVEDTRRALVRAALSSSLQEVERSLDRGADILSQFLEQNAAELSESVRRAVEELQDSLDALEPEPEPEPAP